MNLHPNSPVGQEKKHEVSRDFLLKTARNRIQGLNETAYEAFCARAVAHVARLNLTPKNGSKGYLALHPMAQAQLAGYYADHVMPAEEREAALMSPQSPTPSAADVPAPESQEPPAPASAGPVLSRQWPSAKRGIPSALVRCPLFAGIQRSRGRKVGGSSLPWVSGGLMLRRGGVGTEWTQYDLSVLLQLVQIANECGHFYFGVDEMLTLLGIKPGPSTREALKQSLERLMGVLRIDMEDEEWLHRGSFSLLPDFIWSTRRHAGDRAPKCSGRLAPKFMALYLYGNVTHIDWCQRLALPAGFAQWLHAFYSSHKQPRPIQAAALANLAALASEPKEVNRLIRGALGALQSVGFLSSFEVNRAGLVTVERAAH